MCYSLSQIRAPNFRARHYYPSFQSSSFIFNFSSIYQYIFPSIFSSPYNTFTFLLLSRFTLSVSSQIFTVWFLSYSIFCFNFLQANFISVIFQHKFSVSRSSNAQRYSVVLSTPSFLCTLFSPNPPLCLICSISFSFLLCSFCQFFIVVFFFHCFLPLCLCSCSCCFHIYSQSSCHTFCFSRPSIVPCPLWCLSYSSLSSRASFITFTIYQTLVQYHFSVQ